MSIFCALSRSFIVHIETSSPPLRKVLPNVYYNKLLKILDPYLYQTMSLYPVIKFIFVFGCDKTDLMVVGNQHSYSKRGIA